MKTNEQLEKQISEEFENYSYGKCFTECLDRDDLEFIEDDNGDQFISMNEVDRLVKDITESSYTAAALPLMKRIEELEKGLRLAKIQYGFNLEDVAKRTGGTLSNASLKLMELDFEQRELKLQKENGELREALKWTLSFIDTSFINNFEKAKEIRTKFNLDKEGEK